MKRVIIAATSVLLLAGLALFIYLASWLERTGKTYAPALNYSAHASLELSNFYDNECSPRGESFLDCIRRSRERGVLRGTETIEFRSVLAPPDEVRYLGYLVANDRELYEQGDLPVFVCKTPIDSVRREKGDPPGKSHLAGYAQSGLRRMTPAEFESLDQSLYVDVETIIAALN